MHDRPRLGPVPEVGGELRGQLVEHLHGLAGDEVPVLLAERRHGVADEGDRAVQLLGRGAVQPADVEQGGIAPARAVQERQLVDGGGDLVHGAARHLVTLDGRRDVLQDHDVGVRVGVVGGVVAVRRAHREARREVAVEAGLDLVRAGQAGAGAAGLLGGRDLGDQGGRTGVGVGVVDEQADGVGHLPRADGLGPHRGDLRPEGGRQPLGGHVVGTGHWGHARHRRDGTARRNARKLGR